jgi:hypothetical protein
MLSIEVIIDELGRSVGCRSLQCNIGIIEFGWRFEVTLDLLQDLAVSLLIEVVLPAKLEHSILHLLLIVDHQLLCAVIGKTDIDDDFRLTRLLEGVVSLAFRILQSQFREQGLVI